MAVWKKARRIWGMVCLLLVLAAGLALPAAADVGPKPSVEVVFQGLEGRRYYATLLGNVPQYGPWSAEEEYLDWKGDPEAWEAFAAYPAPEDWYFLGNYADCTETGRFVWSYYPPETFYVLVWLPEEDRCLRSVQPVSRYAFDSRFTVTAAEEGLTVRSSYDYAGEVPGFLVRVALTILIETAAGWLLFGLRRRDQLALIFRVNLVTQLVLNLLLNAVEAMKDNPPERPRTLYISLEPGTPIDARRHYLLLSFEDTGCGISEQDLDNVFNPFFTTKPEGTGLGLAICYGIIRRHGGEIEVSSTPGRGTCFTLKLVQADSLDAG